MSYRLADLAEARVLEYLAIDGGPEEFSLDDDEVRLLLPVPRMWRLATSLCGNAFSLDLLDAIASRNKTHLTGAFASGVACATRLICGEDLEQVRRELSNTASNVLEKGPASIALAVSAVLRLYFWLCITQRPDLDGTITLSHQLELDSSRQRLTDALYGDISATSLALDLLAIERVATLPDENASRALAQMRETALVFRRIEALERQRADYVRAAENIANASQAVGRAVRAAGLEGQAAEDAAHVDIEALSEGKNPTPRRVLEADPRREDIERVRASVLEYSHGCVWPDLQRDATALLSMLHAMGVAQVTGFVRNPMGVDNNDRRAFRQIEDHIRLPFWFPTGSYELSQGPVSFDFDFERERQFLKSLHVTWPARSGVTKASLRSLFSEVRRTGSARSQWVIVSDGEVTWPFILTVLNKVAAASDAEREEWVRGKPNLRTRFVPRRPPLDEAVESWMNDEMWEMGSLDDLILQAGLTDGNGTATQRGRALCSYLTDIIKDGGSPKKLRRGATCFSLLASGTAEAFRESFVEAVRAYGRDHDEVANVKEVHEFSRASFFPEILLRLSPDFRRGETVARALFFFVTQWDFDDAGKRDLPNAFMGGTLIVDTFMDWRENEYRFRTIWGLLQQALAPLMSAALSLVFVEGASQRRLTERERELRRQIAHTMNNDILATKYQFAARMNTILQPLASSSEDTSSAATELLAALPTAKPESIPRRVRQARSIAESYPPNRRPPQWLFDLIESAATGQAAATLQALIVLQKRMEDVLLTATDQLSRLTNISRVLTRLSESRFHAEFSRVASANAVRLADLLAAAFAESVYLAVERASETFEHSKFRELKRQFALTPSNAAIANELLSGNGNGVKGWRARELAHFLDATLNTFVVFEWTCPEDVWIRDVDGGLVAREMMRELTNNAIRALRRVNGKVCISFKVMAGSDGISSLEWSNTTDPENGRRLIAQSAGGQGLAFLGECAVALLVRGANGKVSPGYDDGFAKIRME